jgi:hypothetical protein
LFKIAARNNFGLGSFSDALEVLAAQVPDKPDAPTTFFTQSAVELTWNLPFEQGSPIQGYHVYIRSIDPLAFSMELAHCDGAQEVIRDGRYCSIPTATLMSPPFSLQWGDEIWAKVIAYNEYGMSEESDAGNGATIYTYPDAPIDLREIVASRTSSSTEIQWDDGASDGGSPIIDYRISWDRGLDEWEYLVSGVIYETYTATGLDFGTTY